MNKISAPLLLIVFLVACGRNEDTPKSDLVYQNALALKNDTTCPKFKEPPIAKPIEQFTVKDKGQDILAREEIEIVRRDDAQMYPDTDEQKNKREHSLGFGRSSALERKIDEWDNAAIVFYNDNNSLKNSVAAMRFNIEQMEIGLRYYLYDPRKFSERYPVAQTLDQHAQYFAGEYRKNCAIYSEVAERIAAREKKLAALRKEPKKTWLNSNYKLPCAIETSKRCTGGDN